MDTQQSDEVDSGEGSAGEETPTVLARRRAARKKRMIVSSSKDRFAENFTSVVAKWQRNIFMNINLRICDVV